MAIASERRAVEGILTARHALFCSNFSKIHDFQQVGKNDRGKFVQNAQILQSIAIDCPLENGSFLMPISMKLPQETSRFRANPYIAFRGKRGNNIV